MLKHKESLISAYHNYLVNEMLAPGFILGDPSLADGFYFMAEPVLPGTTVPLISARLFDSEGRFLLHLQRNELASNPCACTLEKLPGGFEVRCSPQETLLSVATEMFANGYLTRIQARLYDQDGQVRVEPSYEGIKTIGAIRLIRT